MNIPDGDKERFNLIIKYIKENKADCLDNIINYIKTVQTDKQYKGIFKNLFSAKFQHINWRYYDYVQVVKNNMGNTEALSILVKHNLLQETLSDGSVFITACKENHYKTIDLILSIPEYGYNMINFNNYHWVNVVCDRGYKESFNIILSHLLKIKKKYGGYNIPEFKKMYPGCNIPEMYWFLNSDRNAKCLELMIIRDDLPLFKIYCKYVCDEYNIKLASLYQEFYNFGAVNCMWYLIKLIKKYKMTITFAKNGYYYDIYKKRKHILKKYEQIVGNMLDCILFSNYLKRTAHI